MAEVLATMMVRPLLSMVTEKASSYLLDQYKVMEGMEEQHEVLKRKLPAILDVITDAEEQAAKQRKGAQAWLEALRKVAYQANDVFDEFKYEALRREAKEKGHYKHLGMDAIKLVPSHNRIVFRYRMGNKLRKILNAIEVLITEMNAFRFEFKEPQPMSAGWRKTDPDISNLSVNIESRAREKEEIVDALVRQAKNRHLMVLPIIGMAGLGKTTLAKLIYNDPRIQNHFQLRLWVCVSDNFEVDSLEKRIIEAAEKEKNRSAASGTSTLDSIKEVVNGKRYLLVLDDIWDLENPKWEMLKSYLQHDDRGCTVLITTRHEKVARLMGTTKKACHLKTLHERFIKEIIETRAFDPQKERPDELVEMVDDFVKRCAGSPLAATALGSVLRTKTTEDEWKAILNRSILCDEENGILPILKLSYNNLPPYMRQCFAFCAIFPKDYEIAVEMLIQLWMANGLVPDQQGACPERTGQQIFDELASRSFFHEVKQITFDKNPSLLLEGNKHSCSGVTCKLHDLMRDVALSAMGKECAAIATELSNKKDFPHSARHLYLSVSKPDTLLNDSREKGSPAIQTLICEGDVNEDLQHLSKYKYIRALRTQQCSFLKPKYLHHLRYLDLSGSLIEALPEDLTILYHLETLNLSGCRFLDRLPKVMKYMIALRHLYTQGCLKLKSMPADFGHLTSLRTLTWFVAGTGSDCSNVKELCQLDDLGGQLELRHLENVTEADATAADLGNKKKLTELTLRWIDRGKETQYDHKEVLGSLKPHDRLKVLRIYSYRGETFPAWMSSLRDMLELELSDCKKIKTLPPIWKLPALQVLRLSRLDNLHCLCSGYTPYIFHKLKELTLSDMPNFKTWWDDTDEVHGEEPIFPLLEKLSIRKCQGLTQSPKLPDGGLNVWSSSFPNLKEQKLEDVKTLETLRKWFTGPLLSMVNENISSYLLEQYRVMEGMEEEHMLLKRKLSSILDVITDAEEQAAAHIEGVKVWLEALRKVAYQADDIINEFIYEALHREARKKGQYQLFSSHNRTIFRYRMRKKLRMILDAFEVLVAEMDDFNFRSNKPQPKISMNGSEIKKAVIEDMVIDISRRSRDKEKKDIVKALLAQANSADLMVLPIVGMGGLGKTTLAQLIYNDPEIQKHFQLLLWVCVSDDFDVDSLAKSIVEAATKQNSRSEKSGESPLNDLQKIVNGKRYLLVLDDVWNRDVHKWEKLKSCLQHGGSGSSVLTTTRDDVVARLMGTNKPYYLESFDDVFIKEIICTRAFSSRKEKPADELLEMVDDIVKRCAGSPLAATALGSILGTKTTADEWKAVLSTLTRFDDESGIIPILNQSYNCLPPHMRQCFAFCAMFPKGYEIDVEMLIQLWIANGFIPVQEGERLESIGEQIFKELVSKSFFQDVQIVPFGEELVGSMLKWRKHRYGSRTCRIHDLMHDVALSAMGKECVTIVTTQSQSEDFLYSARHLLLSVDEPETILNAFHRKGSPAIQTLICEGDVKEGLQHLLRFSSLRALRFQGQSFPKPKYLHHLRYLDISNSHINALPEDISTLYYLQTLNLSGCYKLKRLPKEMKFMTALRHLYTHGCHELKSMPAELGHITSLQTLTYFAAGTGSGCSTVGELHNLDLGGQLELSQLENVTEADAIAANLGNKKKMTGLTLKWTACDEEAQDNDKKVLEALKPHDGLRVVRIYSCGSTTCPSWMNMLLGMEVLELSGCKWLDELPALWQLPALQVLCLRGLESLYCLCSGSTLFPFRELKVLILSQMPNFSTWWNTNGVQGEEPILFPLLEILSIENCASLTTLPKAFPALKEMKLCSLEMFQRWEANEDGSQGEGVTFPWLEKLKIQSCPELKTLPEAPQLSLLELDGCNQQMSLQAACRYITSLSEMKLEMAADGRETTLQAEQDWIELTHDKVKWNHISPVRALELGGCGVLFSHASALELWVCLQGLVDLKIRRCDALVNWPDEVFQNLVSLRTLQIVGCNKLTGRGQASEQSVPEWRGLLPRLESLEIIDCASLVEVPNIPPSLRNLLIEGCHNSQFIVFAQQVDTRLVSGQGTTCQDTESLIPGSSSEATASSVVLKLSSSANYPFLPCLESLTIKSCGGLSEIANLPPSIRTLNIHNCSNLRFLSGQLDALQTLCIWSCSELRSLESCIGELQSLEELELRDCKNLVSLPNGPRSYSSLRTLRIESCSGIKLLPPSLQQHYKEPKTCKYAVSQMSCFK